MAYIDLFLDWMAVGTAYQARHIQNYSAIESALNSLNERVTGQISGTAEMPVPLQEIFDRKGLIGKDSYSVADGVLTGPGYNLTVGDGAYWSGAYFRHKITDTLISMVGQLTDTYYVNIDASGTPGLATSAGADTVRQFDYDADTHTVSNSARYAGVAVLFDGDDYADMLTSAVKATTYDSVAARLEAIEAAAGSAGDVWADYYAQDLPHDDLNFKYKAGLVRNDADLYETVAGQVALTDDATNYVELDPTDGSIGLGTGGFTSGLIPLYTVVCASGAITDVTDERTAAIAGTGGEGGGHTQNTDTGTTATEFEIDSDDVAATGRAGIKIGNGGYFEWNRDSNKWQWSADGVTWHDLDPASDLLAVQELEKVVPVDDPPQVLYEAGRSTSEDYEELDLSSYLAETPVRLVTLAVFMVDAAPGALVNIGFRKAGIVPEASKAAAVWATAAGTDPGIVQVEPDSSGKLEFFVTASGTGTATVEVYLLNYTVAKVGVGTQDRSQAVAGIEAAAASEVTQDVTSWLNRGLVHYLKVEETGGLGLSSYDLEIYGKDTFLAADLMYQAQGLNPAAAFEDWLPWWYKDKDATSELHLKIINNDASLAGTFTVTLEAEQFA